MNPLLKKSVFALVLTVVLSLFLMPMVSAQFLETGEFDLGESVGRAFDAIGDALIHIQENENALYGFTFMLYFGFIAGILSMLARNSHLFGGQGNLDRAGIVVITCFSLAVCMSLFAFGGENATTPVQTTRRLLQPYGLFGGIATAGVVSTLLFGIFRRSRWFGEGGFFAWGIVIGIAMVWAGFLLVQYELFGWGILLVAGAFIGMLIFRFARYPEARDFGRPGRGGDIGREVRGAREGIGREEHVDQAAQRLAQHAAHLLVIQDQLAQGEIQDMDALIHLLEQIEQDMQQYYGGGG